MKFLFLISFLISFLILGSIAGAQTLSPGIWHAETDFRVDGIPLPASIGESCVTPEQAKDAKATLTQSLDKIGCVITDWKVIDNNLNASLTCRSDKLDAKGTIEGTFTDKTYELSGQAHGFYEHIFPSVASLKLHGRWISDCPN